jgi:hypothetical protein
MISKFEGAELVVQRTGIADGWEFEIRPLELLPGFLIKLNNKY